MHRYLRFCQPIGCALITLALLDTTCNFFWLLVQYCGMEHRYFVGDSAVEDYWKHVAWNFLLALRFFCSLVLWRGVIIMGKNIVMVFWLVISFLNDAAIVTFVILEKLSPPAPSSSTSVLTINIWGTTTLASPYPTFISVGVFIIFRLYFLLVALQGGFCLHQKYDKSRSRSISDNISDIDVCTEPIGLGVWEVWVFFKDFPALGSIVLLTTEMIWNIEHLGMRELFVFFVEKPGKALLALELDTDVASYVFLEDNLMRCIRVFLGFVGLYFVHREHLNLVRLWILVYLISFVCTNVIFALSVAMQDVYWIVFHAICLTFDNLFRLLVLCISFKFAIVHRRTIAKI